MVSIFSTAPPLGDVSVTFGWPWDNTADTVVFFNHGSHTYAYASYASSTRTDDVLIRLATTEAVASISTGTGGDADLFTLA